MDKTVRLDGGIGRVIAASGAIEEYAKKEVEQGNKVYVATGFPELLYGLEGIERIYPLQIISENKVKAPPFFYEDILCKTQYLEPEPYNDYSYYAEEKHLTTVYNKLLNGVNEFIQPKLVLSENELGAAKQFIADERKAGKKIILMQPWGSGGGKVISNEGEPEERKMAIDESYRSFGSEFAKKLCSRLTEEGYTVYLVKSNDQVGFKECKTFNNLDLKKIIALIPFVDGVIACDSFLHHASAALETPVPTIVLWAGTSEKNLGYEGQVNLHSWKKTLNEPNRAPHDHDYYVNKNKGSNEFKFEMIDEIISALKKEK